jgi:hypothetical protein
MSYIFTFGMASPYAGCYVEIAGEYMEARERMIATFDKDWAFQYSSLSEATRDGKYQLTDITNDHIPPEWRVVE